MISIRTTVTPVHVDVVVDKAIVMKTVICGKTAIMKTTTSGKETTIAIIIESMTEVQTIQKSLSAKTLAAQQTQAQALNTQANQTQILDTQKVTKIKNMNVQKAEEAKSVAHNAEEDVAFATYSGIVVADKIFGSQKLTAATYLFRTGG